MGYLSTEFRGCSHCHQGAEGRLGDVGRQMIGRQELCSVVDQCWECIVKSHKGSQQWLGEGLG